MRSKLFHDVSRHLAIRLERAIAPGLFDTDPASGQAEDRDARESPQGGEPELEIPVFLCHPIDVLEDRDLSSGPPSASGAPSSSGPTGVLYLAAIRPETRFRNPAGRVESPDRGSDALVWRPGGAWARLAFRFFVLRAPLRHELAALEQAFANLADEPFVRIRDLPSVERLGLSTDAAVATRFGAEELPIELVAGDEAWREVGLAEHRLALGFDVLVSIPSGRARPLGRVVERGLQVELSADDAGRIRPGRAGVEGLSDRTPTGGS